MELGCKGPVGPVPLKTESHRLENERGWPKAIAGRRKSGCEDSHVSRLPVL